MTNTTKRNFRKDIVSNQMFDKAELIRIVKDKNGSIKIDRNKTANGRGVYFIPTLANLELVKKKNLLTRSLKTKVDDSIYELITLEINEVWING